MVELPGCVEAGYEQLVLSFVNRVRLQCPKVHMFVQPSLRRHSNRSIWVSRWNEHNGHRPFAFRETCSCQMGDGAPGCHIRSYVGTGSHLALKTCDAIPTTDVTLQTANDSLRSLLQFFCSHVTSNLVLKYRAGSGSCRGTVTYGARVGDTRGVGVPTANRRLNNDGFL